MLLNILELLCGKTIASRGHHETYLENIFNRRRTYKAIYLSKQSVFRYSAVQARRSLHFTLNFGLLAVIKQVDTLLVIQNRYGRRRACS